MAQRLRELIADGVLGPGQAIPQAATARRLRVSRTPVREAIGILASEGLVTIRPNQGAIVFQPSAADLLDIYGIRGDLEASAAADAAARRSSADLDELYAIQERMASPTPWRDYRRLNTAFHASLYGAAGRPRLLSLIQTLRLQAEPYIVPGTPEEMRQARQEHADLLEAVAQGDAVRASAITRTHLEHAAAMALVVLHERSAVRDEF